MCQPLFSYRIQRWVLCMTLCLWLAPNIPTCLVVGKDAGLCHHGQFFVAHSSGQQGAAFRCECYPGWLGPHCNITHCQSFDDKGCTACRTGMTNTSNQCRDVACTSFKPDPIEDYLCTQKDCSSLGYYGPQCRSTHCLARSTEEAHDPATQRVIRNASCTRCDPGWSGPDCLVSLCRHGESDIKSGACHQPCSEPGFYGSFCNKSNALFSVQDGKRVFDRCMSGYQSVLTADCSALACAHGLVNYSAKDMTCFQGSCLVGWTGPYCDKPLCHAFNETGLAAQQKALAHWKVDHAAFAQWLAESKAQALSGHPEKTSMAAMASAPLPLPPFDYVMPFEITEICMLDASERSHEMAKQQCQKNGLWNGTHCHCYRGWQGQLCDFDVQAHMDQMHEQACQDIERHVASLSSNASALFRHLALLRVRVQDQQQAYAQAQAEIEAWDQGQVLITESIVQLEGRYESMVQQTHTASEKRATVLRTLLHLDQQNFSLTQRFHKLHQSAAHLQQQLEAFESAPDMARFIQRHHLGQLNDTAMVALSRGSSHAWQQQLDNLTRCHEEQEALIATHRVEVLQLRWQQSMLADTLASYQNQSAVLWRRVQSEQSAQARALIANANRTARLIWLSEERRNISDAMQSLRLNMSHGLDVIPSLLVPNASAWAAKLSTWRSMAQALNQSIRLNMNETLRALMAAVQMKEEIRGSQLELVNVQRNNDHLTEALLASVARDNASQLIESWIQQWQHQGASSQSQHSSQGTLVSLSEQLRLLNNASRTLKDQVKEILVPLSNHRSR